MWAGGRAGGRAGARAGGRAGGRAGRRAGGYVVFFPSRFFSRAANLSSGMNDVHATRQVCCPAEKTARKKLYDNFFFFTFMQTRDMYLHFTRSNIWANGNNYNFSSRMKIRSFPMLFNGRTLIFTFSRTQVRIAEIERLQSLFKMSMVELVSLLFISLNAASTVHFGVLFACGMRGYKINPKKKITKKEKYEKQKKIYIYKIQK